MVLEEDAKKVVAAVLVLDNLIDKDACFFFLILFGFFSTNLWRQKFQMQGCIRQSFSMSQLEMERMAIHKIFELRIKSNL